MEFNEIKKYIVKNVYSGLLKTIITLSLSVVVLPIIITKVGLEQYGIISISVLFFNFSGVLDLGLSKSLVYFQKNTSNNNKEISAIYILNLTIFSCLLLCSLLVYLLNINFIGNNLKTTSLELKWLNTISFLLLAFAIFNNLLRASLEAHFKLQIVNYGFLIQSLCVNLGWLILALLDANLLCFFFVPLITVFITIAYHLHFLPSIYNQLQLPDKSDFKKVFHTTIQFFKLGVLNSLHMPLMKYLIILFSGQGVVIGIFDLSIKLTLLVSNILSYISTPLFSIISKYKNTTDTYVKKLLNKITLLLLFISSVGYIVFLFLEKYIIIYFFKTYSSEIFNVLNILLIGYLLLAISEGVHKFLLGTGKANTMFCIKLSSLLLNFFLLCVFFLLNNLNIVTISLSLSLSFVFISLFLLIYLIRKI